MYNIHVHDVRVRESVVQTGTTMFPYGLNRKYIRTGHTYTHTNAGEWTEWMEENECARALYVYKCGTRRYLPSHCCVYAREAYRRLGYAIHIASIRGVASWLVGAITNLCFCTFVSVCEANAVCWRCGQPLLACSASNVSRAYFRIFCPCR